MPKFVSIVLPLLAPLFAEAQMAGGKAVNVAPGQQADVVIRVDSPREGTMLYVEANLPRVTNVLSFFLPDGREMTDDVMLKEGFRRAWLGEPEDTKQPDSALVRLVMILPDTAPRGNYRIHVDNRTSKSLIQVKAHQAGPAEIILDAFRRKPGVQIVGPVKTPRGVRTARLSLVLKQSTEESLIDVAIGRAPAKIRLRLPDGRVITQDNAQENGMEWAQSSYPVAGGGSLADTGAAIFAEAMMLPVNGVHYAIVFSNGVPQAGNYIVEADAPATEISAMFMTVE